MRKIFFSLLTITFALSVQAQKSIEKSVIEVDGVCGMCKARIEKTSFKIKGVKSASWSTDTHQLTLIYDTSKASLDSIQKQIARVGHNTPLFKAPDEAYEALPMCCKYKTVEDH
ncbi:MAG: heavy-metal-associated domain-containing protein [Flavobacteriaceae bacterium]|jgi:cation transport ATPase|nr:heavy-metal-associated domain-containing protein [Flavobacteriaceae bacterium]